MKDASFLRKRKEEVCIEQMEVQADHGRLYPAAGHDVGLAGCTGYSLAGVWILE